MRPASAPAFARVAVREGGERTPLSPLSESVNTEALASLLESDATATARFEYEGDRVVIGPVALEPPRPRGRRRNRGESRRTERRFRASRECSECVLPPQA
ncbi:HalOD1 output domain-containing protein [Natrarchaeobius chitinivorans]|uniref:HalOD1 output domain-containing protein n=1 Tax=Natrarchaeobius chitinivorans TaxID=1679083 RepID=UPI001404C9B2